MFEGGRRIRDWSPKDLVPFSGRLLPEFDRRRSIKDMFRKPPNTRVEANPLPALDSSMPSLVESTTQEISDSDSLGRAPIEDGPGPTEPSRIIKPTHFQPLPESTLQDKPPPPKRRKPNSSSKESITSTNNQKTLKSFFQPKQNITNTSTLPSPSTIPTPLTPKRSASEAISESPNDSPNNRSSRYRGSTEPSITSTHPSTISSSASQIPSFEDNGFANNVDEDKVVDPEETQMGWTKIFSKRDPPRCEGHNEPCVNLETKKKGVNCGRRFWICAR